MALYGSVKVVSSAFRAVVHTNELASACRMNQRHADTSRLWIDRWMVAYHALHDSHGARLHDVGSLATHAHTVRCTIHVYLSSHLAAFAPRRCVIMGDNTSRSSSASSTSRYTLGAKVCTVSPSMLPQCAQPVASAAAAALSGRIVLGQISAFRLVLRTPRRGEVCAAFHLLSIRLRSEGTGTHH